MCSDLDALKRILTQNDSTGQLARRRMGLTEFNFEVVHREWSLNQGTDTLLRLKPESTYITIVEDDIPRLVQHWSSNSAFTKRNRTAARQAETVYIEAMMSSSMTCRRLHRWWPPLCKQRSLMYRVKKFQLWKNSLKQAADIGGKDVAPIVGHPAPCYIYDGDAILICTSPVDGAHQMFSPSHYVPASYTCITSSLWQETPWRDVCMTMLRQHILWQHMTNDRCTLVHGFWSCARNGCQVVHWRKIQIFPAFGLL